MSFASRPIVFAPKRTHRRSREVVAEVKLKIVLVLLLMAAVVTGRADEPSPQTGDSAGAASAESWRNFENLVNTINGAQQELAALRKQLQQTHEQKTRKNQKRDTAKAHSIAQAGATDARRRGTRASARRGQSRVGRHRFTRGRVGDVGDRRRRHADVHTEA